MSDADALRALMEADRWADRVRTQRDRLPERAELASVEDELRAMASALAEARAARDPVRTAFEDAARESERLRAREAEIDAALASPTAGSRELAAISAERDQVRARRAEAEDRELELLVEVEPLDEVVGAVRERARPLAERREALRASVEALTAGLEEEAAALSRDRVAVADAVPAGLRARYDDALARVGASGAAQVVDGRCDGCRIALAPLDLDRWRAAPEGEFPPCASCGRLLLP